MKPMVRQIKGPGMNRGMSKPRKIAAQPKPIADAKMSGMGKASNSSSYLPVQGLAKGGKVQAMTSGKGKVISCQNY